MSVFADSIKRRGLSPALLLGCAVTGLALPSAVLAFSSDFSGPVLIGTAEPTEIGHLTRASVDQNLARSMNAPGLARGQLFRFTPAGTATRPDRSVMVAVRVDADTAQSISIRPPQADGAPVRGLAAVRIAPTAYSLGVARGFQGFTLLGDSSRRGDTPDLAAFKLGAGTADEPSRLNARIAFDERDKTGRAPRTLEGNGEQTVDVGGSYRLTRNLNVTAGVRYSQERDRLVPLAENQRDAQAVYVGTQFRF